MTTKRRGRPKKVEEPVVEVAVEIEEVAPIQAPNQKYYVEVREGHPLTEHQVNVSTPVGTITYYDSTQAIEWTYEARHYEYMRSFVGRDIDVVNAETGTVYSVPVSELKRGVTELHKADIHGQFFATEPVVRYEE